MTNCSKRRKTKHPFCKNEPKCYWNKRCKNRTFKKHSLKDSEKLSKLDTIIYKLSLIDKKLKILDKNTSKRVNTSKHIKKKQPFPSLTNSNRVKVDKSNTNNYMNNVDNKIKNTSNKTPSLNKVEPLINNRYNNPKVISPINNNFVLSPEARQQIRDL